MGLACCTRCALDATWSIHDLYGWFANSIGDWLLFYFGSLKEKDWVAEEQNEITSDHFEEEKNRS